MESSKVRKEILKDRRLKNIQTTAEGKSMLRALYKEKTKK